MTNFWKRNWEDDLLSFCRKNYSEIKLLAVVFLLELIIYGQKAVSHSLATDDYARFYNGASQQIAWYGRWLNEIISGSVLSGALHILPYGNFVVGLFFVTLSAYLGTKIFNLNSAFSKGVFILLCTVSPFWAENFFYNTNFVVWIFNFIGVYGFYLILGNKQKKVHWLHWLLALLIIVAAISVYQAILQLLLVILLFRIVFEILDMDDPKDIFPIVFKNSLYGILLVLSFSLYSLINNYYYSLLTTADSIVRSPVTKSLHGELLSQDLLSRIAAVYLSITAYISPLFFELISSKFGNMYTSDGFFHYGRFQYLFVYLLMLLAVLTTITVGIIVSDFGNRRKNLWIKTSVLLLIFLFLPLIINLPIIIGAVMPVRAYYPIGWVLAISFSMSYRFSSIYKNLNRVFLTAIMIFSFYYINIFFYWAYFKTEFDMRMINQIVTVIRTHSEYQDEEEPMQLWIEGGKFFEFTGANWGGEHQPFRASTIVQYISFKHFSDFNFEKMEVEDYKAIAEQLIEEKATIQGYPAKSSIYIDGRNVVLFLDPTDIDKKIKKGKNHE